MKRLRQSWLYYKLPPILWAAMIILVSTMPKAQPPTFDIPNIDKFYHGLEYFVFGMLIFRAFPDLPRSKRPGLWYILLFLFGFAYAGVDETVQSLVPNRDSSWGDYAADVIGFAAAGLCVLLYRRFRRSRLEAPAASKRSPVTGSRR